MVRRTLLIFALLLAFAPMALAGDIKLGTVDFQEAINQVAEGEAAAARLDAIYKGKKASLEQMESKLKQMQDEYDKQAMILSADALKQKQGEMMQAQQAYQQAYMNSEGEFQQQYQQVMGELIDKMQVVVQAIGKEQGYSLILEVNQGSVVYSGGATDVTAELVKRYNAAHPGQ